MEQVSWLLEVAVNEGCWELFERARSSITDKIEDEEPGTLSYEWHANEEQQACHLFVRFRDSEAALEHLRRFEQRAEAFLQVCVPKRLCLYGAPNADVRNALEPFHPLVLDVMTGFVRS